MAAGLFAMGSIAQGCHVLCAQTDFALLLWAGQCEKKDVMRYCCHCHSICCGMTAHPLM